MQTQIPFDLATFLQAAMGALIWLVYNNLTREVERVERAAAGDSAKNTNRIERLEVNLTTLPQQIERISRDVSEAIAKLDLKLASQYPTKQELDAVAAGRSVQFEAMQAKVDRLSDEVTRLIANISSTRTPHNGRHRHAQ